ncbi:cell wall metabolism sensor histidine kinase WalK [Aeromicrobium sp. 9AM]|uniref:sensor histidine kinase n=1 Tax=Aeromicrobium sp. 9AM TaxID=2653126 RepID=UPI0012F2019B|nr:HAMP domain-containing sensor histidine kinase [Aeromicrobium sp. 9AM]VXB83987.1 putative sensor histidine kinase TcrY [Aeromicrobium sp. 9AM]
MRKVLPSSLTGRLIVTVVALVAVASLLVAGVVTVVMSNYLTDRLDEKLTQSMGRAQHTPPRDAIAPDGRRPDPGRGQDVGLITVVPGRPGSIVTEDGDAPAISTAARDLLAEVSPDGTPRDIDLPKYGSYRVLAAEAPDGSICIVGLPRSSVDNTIGNLIWWEVLLALGATGVAGVAGRLLVRRQLRPLREVAATAHEVIAMPLSSGEIGQTVRVPADLTDPNTEVGQVGGALNQLLGHVEEALDARHESEQQVRQFLADASHELRTPLSTIKGYAELSRRTGRADPDQILAKVESEAGRMSTLVEDMLLLARLDSGREIDRRPVDLTRLLVEAVNDARVVDPERHWTFDVPDEPVTVTGDEQRLHQAVTNLLTNASRHTPPETTVDVRLRVADMVRIEVHDNGPGIDPELVPTIFERFVRGDSSRTRASGGAGLGMSLVRAIMHAHRGTATVESSPGDTTFTLTLPAS